MWVVPAVGFHGCPVVYAVTASLLSCHLAGQVPAFPLVAGVGPEPSLCTQALYVPQCCLLRGVEVLVAV